MPLPFSPLGCRLPKFVPEHPLPPRPLPLRAQLGHLWQEEGAGDRSRTGPHFEPPSHCFLMSFDILALPLTPSCLLSSVQVAF